MKKKMIAPVVVAVLLVAYFVFYAVMVVSMPDMNMAVKVLGVVVPVVFAGYAVWAAKERIEEIQGGEEDDLSQY